MRLTRRARLAMTWAAVMAAAVAAPHVAAAVQQGPPPPPTAASGQPVRLVASGLPVPSQIAVAYGRVFIATPGDEETGKGGGVYAVWRGRVTRIERGPAIGLVYRAGTLYASSFNKIVAFGDFEHGRFTTRRVVFSRPAAELPFLETMALGPDGRLYVGTSDAGDTGPIGAPLAGRVLAISADGSQVEELAKGLRQPFGIGFVAGDPVPYVANESDESTPTPGDFIVHAVTGSDYGFPGGCQWHDPAAAACAGKTPPTVLLPPHSSPTGMVGRGDALYVAFFGGTTKAGPEIRALRPGSTSRRLVSSPLPLVGVGWSGGHLYFGDVGGSVYRVRVP